MKKTERYRTDGPVASPLPEYKTYRIPTAMVDWENPDVMFKEEGNDEQKRKFFDLLRNYRIHSWTVENNGIRILFALR